MDKRIWLITSSYLALERAKKIFEQLGYDYPCVRVSFDDLSRCAADAIAQGAQIFISRGKSATLLKQFGLPVVSLRFTYYDFVSAIQQAKQFSDRIAIVGYKDSWHQSFQPYQEILDDPISVYLESPDQLEEALKGLQKQGVEVIIGGVATTQLAIRFGMKAVQIGVEDSSIIDSVADARYLLQIELQRSTHMSTVNTILNNATEGILSINAQGQIDVANESARQILGPTCVGSDISAYIPNQELLLAARQGLTFSRELVKINHVPCTLNISSLSNIDGSVGSVFTFQPVEQVRSLEQNIRKNLVHGNIAKSHFEDIIGQSEAILFTIDQAKQFARSNSTVLICGETGTGKELFAQSIHNHSPRVNGPFVALNCAALPQNILESELFGYVKGAFTGASSEGRAGYFEMAHMGTIFLDEIGEMPLDIQVKLLRVLQEKEIRRIGDRKVFHIDVRVIAATNQDLSRLVKEGKFREDLYYRLAVLELYLPPLREREGDVVLLASHILQEIAQRENVPPKRFSSDAEGLLSSLDWLGNVRQLRNIVERVFVISNTDTINAALLQKVIHVGPHSQHTLPHEEKRRISPASKERIANALKAENGNRERTAKRLGISKTTLWRRIREIERFDPGYFDLF